MWARYARATRRPARDACSVTAGARQASSTARRPFRVSVEGNIGSGKSTLIKHFANFPDVDVQLEPVEAWRDVRGVNLLELLYQDTSRWNTAFQSYVQLSRLRIQTRPTDRDIQMFERSLQNNRFCFVEMAHDNGQLSHPEYVVLCEWYDWISSHIDISLDLIVYLRCEPEVAHGRVLARGRPEERCLPLCYLRRLHEAHERWLLGPGAPAPVLQLDAGPGQDYVRGLYERILGAAARRTFYHCRRVESVRKQHYVTLCE
ncbi:deoxynucleoside kinase-like [Bacillus rossius redtenbacheri]|uniref:deoxynucleoside kinase-like n=1 Tax=Bacillus rossius redtenbacheri TaxID=93214 RepID=UPI002FDCA33F